MKIPRLIKKQLECSSYQ